MPTALDLFERHHVEVYRFLRRLTSSREDAEDLTQEVFLRVLRALPTYVERHERAWVFRIARNLVLDRWRAGGRTPRMERLAAGGEVAAQGPYLDALALEEALARLPDAEREAFVLREVAGLGYLEIAEVMGATPDAVRNRIHRARLTLREALGPGRMARSVAAEGSR